MINLVVLVGKMVGLYASFKYNILYIQYIFSKAYHQHECTASFQGSEDAEDACEEERKACKYGNPGSGKDVVFPWYTRYRVEFISIHRNPNGHRR